MNFETKRLGERRLERVGFETDLTKVEPKNPYGGPDLFQERYVLEMRVRTDFWSNSVQLPRKEHDAKKAAYACIFKDMLPIVHEIILDCDDDEIREMALRLKDMMAGEDAE